MQLLIFDFLNKSEVAVQKTLSSIDSLDIIPLTKKKVKRFFLIFQTFLKIFDFFYFCQFFRVLFEQKSLTHVLCIICRA